MPAPEFWQNKGPVSSALLPLSLLWRSGAFLRSIAATPIRPGIPVICVGNLIAGGAGKTPVALELAKRLVEMGRKPAFLTRGYGGRVTGPHLVDRERDTSAAVGDEPLLLARTAPTWVARDRGLGALAARNAGADVLVMDDGFQNPTVVKDLPLLVVDGGFGFGNGRVIPSGPLREPLQQGLQKAAGLIIIGEDETGITTSSPADLPILTATLRPDAEIASELNGKRVYAFAGIGRPQKFYETLQSIGAQIVGTHDFPDHQPYDPGSWASIQTAAQRVGAVPVTTEKDWMRLSGIARPDQVSVLPVHLVFDQPDMLGALLSEGMANGR